MSRFHRRAVPAVALLATLALSAGSASAAPTQAGPSTATDPYVLPVADGVETTSIFTVSDALAAGNGYEMTGIPDGLGAVEQGRNLIVYMNQELNQTAGAVRRHGERGAFVSRLVLDRIDPESEVGIGLGSNPGVQYWDYPNGTFSAAPDAIGQDPPPTSVRSRDSAPATSPRPASCSTPRRRPGTEETSTSRTKRSTRTSVRSPS